MMGERSEMTAEEAAARRERRRVEDNRRRREQRAKKTPVNPTTINNARNRAKSGVAHEPYKIRCIEVDSRNIPLMDLHDDECRWPVSDDSPFLFCGLLKLDGSSYCPAHFRLSIIPAPVRRSA